MEAGHPVVAALQHLREGGELHGPSPGPPHPHSPHVHQLGAHDAAHGGSSPGQGMEYTGIHSLLYTQVLHVRAASISLLITY